MDKEIPIETRKREKRKRLIRYAIVLMIPLIMVICLIRFMEPTLPLSSVLTEMVDRGTIEITIHASGKVVPVWEEIIVSPINSRILETYRQPGEFLQAGDPILKLELASVETDYKQKLDEREVKKSKLELLKVNHQNTVAEIKMQEQVKEMQLKQMYTEWQNERYLDSIGASTTDKIRQAEINYEVARLELQQLNQQRENKIANSNAEVKVQELEISIFEKSLAESLRLLEDARIRSPRAATLTYINNQIGEHVSQGTQVAIISDLENYKVEAEISDGYAEKLSLGAKAVIRTTDISIEGMVSNIVPSVKNGTINFIVLLGETNNPRLRSGLKTDVHVKYGLSENVLRIPNAKFYAGEGYYDLWVVNGNQAKKRRVRLGERSFEYIEVLEGLREGDQIILSDDEMNRYRKKQTIKIR